MTYQVPIKTSELLRRACDPAVRDEHGGLCWNVENYPVDPEYPSMSRAWRVIPEQVCAIKLAMQDWPQRNKSGIYPVDGETEFEVGWRRGTLWQNPRRLALLAWLVEHFETKGD